MLKIKNLKIIQSGGTIKEIPLCKTLFSNETHFFIKFLHSYFGERDLIVENNELYNLNTTYIFLNQSYEPISDIADKFSVPLHNSSEIIREFFVLLLRNFPISYLVIVPFLKYKYQYIKS